MAVPLCAYFGKCQGCSLQQVEYALQLENKRKRLVKMINFDDVKVFSDTPYYYRNRLELFWSKNALCLRGKGGLIPIEQCVIVEEKINVLITKINAFFAGCEDFHGVVIRSSSKASSISFACSTASEEFIEKVKLFNTTADTVLVTITDDFYGADYIVIKGDDFLEEDILGKKFIFPIQGFFQNNTKMMQKMQSHVHSLLRKYPTIGGELLDLYAGVGTFGMVNAALFKNITLVENFKPAIEAAEKNLRLNTIKHGRALVLSGGQTGRVWFTSPLYVITDPPRIGMEQKAIIELNRLKPEVIIYVSCNVEQLQKDILKFKQYKVKSATLFDLFPQTKHSEAVVELVRV